MTLQELAAKATKNELTFIPSAAFVIDLLTSEIEKRKSSMSRKQRASKKCVSLADKVAALNEYKNIADQIREMRIKLFDAEDLVVECFSLEKSNPFLPMANTFPLASEALTKRFP